MRFLSPTGGRNRVFRVEKLAGLSRYDIPHLGAGVIVGAAEGADVNRASAPPARS